MAHRVLNGSKEVQEYERYLDEGWPVREQVSQHLCERLGHTGAGGQRILELACGPGALASAILASLPVDNYVGVDISPSSIDFARNRVAEFDAKTDWLQGDLNGDEWLGRLEDNIYAARGGAFDAVVSMQSIHDLGGETEVSRIFGIVHRLLFPGGRFLYADLLRSPSDPPGSNPGRFDASRHLELLAQAGFDDAACTLQFDGFGCFEAVRR